MVQLLKLSLIVFFAALVVSCGPNLNEAKKKGFDSVEELLSAEKQGYKTKSEVNEAAAKKEGFPSYEEMVKRKEQGFETVADVEAAQLKSREKGFDSIEEMLLRTKEGYETKADYLKEEARVAAAKALEEKKQAELESIKEYASICQRGVSYGDLYTLFRANKVRLAPSVILLGTTVGAHEIKGYELESVNGGAKVYISSERAYSYSGGDKNLVKAGVGIYKNRQLPACLERVKFKFFNRSAGERSEACVSVLYLKDEEFDLDRELKAFTCDQEGQSINSWREENKVKVFLDLK